MVVAAWDAVARTNVEMHKQQQPRQESGTEAQHHGSRCPSQDVREKPQASRTWD